MFEGADNPVVVMFVAAALTYDIIAAACSSPQTTEINAAARSETLMKWVYISLAQVALFAVLGVAIEAKRGKEWWPVAAGSLIGAVLMWGQYVYARNEGLKNAHLPGTETYAPVASAAMSY